MGTSCANVCCTRVFCVDVMPAFFSGAPAAVVSSWSNRRKPSCGHEDFARSKPAGNGACRMMRLQVDGSQIKQDVVKERRESVETGNSVERGVDWSRVERLLELARSAH